MTFEDWARRLGVTREVVDQCFSQPTQEEARRALADLKAEAKKRYRAFARQLHPDLGGYEDDLKSLNTAWDAIEGLDLIFPEPEPVPEPPAVLRPVQQVTVMGNWIKIS